jgi:LacI family transcriptional regulator
MEYTIYDLAKECNVSVATVSRVINNSSSVSEKTKARVLNAIQVHNYAPNIFARGLNKIGTNVIGVLITDIGNPFFSTVVKSIETIFQKHRYEIMLFSTENNTELERQGLELLLQKQVDGLILAGSRPVIDKNEQFIQEISTRLPVILINSKISGGDQLYSILVDEETASYEALRKLAKQGYNNIYLLGDPEWKTTQSKIKAFRRIASEYSLEYSEDRIISCSYNYQSGINGITKLFERHISFPALLFCTSDQIAIGALKELLRRHICIPEQIAVLGYSNTELASLMTPSLTTVDQKMPLLGEQAAKLFIAIQQGQKILSKVQYSPYDIIFRETT